MLQKHRLMNRLKSLLGSKYQPLLLTINGAAILAVSLYLVYSRFVRVRCSAIIRRLIVFSPISVGKLIITRVWYWLKNTNSL